MSDLWLAGWDRIPGVDSGTWAPDDENAPKFVVHSTEGYTIADAVASYTHNRSWPHATADPTRHRMVQHLPLNRPARALKNTSVPGQTNREPTTIQLEVVGTAHLPATAEGKVSLSALSGEDLDWLGRAVIGPMCRLAGVELACHVTFYAEDCGWTLATPSARQRLTAAQWDKATGILGHQHVPENDHWDPGHIDIDRILAAARGNQPTTEDIDMTADELNKLLDAKLAPIVKDLAEVKRQVSQSQDEHAKGGRTLRHIDASILNKL